MWLAILFLKALLLHMGLIGIHLFIHIVECKITHAIIITSARHIPSYPRYVMLIYHDCTFIIGNFTLVFHRSLSLSLSLSLFLSHLFPPNFTLFLIFCLIFYFAWPTSSATGKAENNHEDENDYNSSWIDFNFNVGGCCNHVISLEVFQILFCNSQSDLGQLNVKG